MTTFPLWFEEKIQRSAGCWEWTGSRNRQGYGYASGRQLGRFAHRVAWQLLYGPLAPSLLVCHRCDNPPCVRPDHLFVGTVADNSRDMVAKGRGRGCPGESNNHAKLTASQVMEIRSRYVPGGNRSSTVGLAAEFGVTHAMISRIVRGIAWRSVGEYRDLCEAETDG